MLRAQKTTHAAADAETDLLQKLSSAIRAYLGFFDRHPHYIELLLQERAIFRSRRPPSYFKNRDVNRSRWREVYLALMEQGRIRNDLPVERILDVVGSLLYGAIFTNYFVGRSVSAQEQFEAIWSVLLNGIQTRCNASPRRRA
jgi:AcrR family transcriptional regulator